MLARLSFALLLIVSGCASSTQGNGAGVTSAGGDGGATGCTYTQGYWKTHPKAWPVTSLTIGGVTYTEAQLLTLFQTAPAGDASLVLAHQLIAAMLNVAAGVTAPSAVSTAISQAQAWMTANLPAGGHLGYGTPSSSAAGMQATTLAGQLDSFNSGMAGVAHCGDVMGDGGAGDTGGTGGPGGMGGSTTGGGSSGGGSTGGSSGGGSNCANGCSDGGLDPCAGVTCPSGYACFQGVCQPPVQ